MSTSTPSQPKKKIAITDLLIGLIPLVIMLVLNTVATIPAFAVGFYEANTNPDFNPDGIMNVIECDAAQNALAIGFICYSIISIVIMGIWYKKAFLKKQVKISNKEVFAPKTVALTIGGAIGVWSIVNLALDGLYAVIPDAIDRFSQSMDSAGIGSNFIITLVYACILGPIAEEFYYRAVTQGYARRSGIAAVGVIIFQAALFGIAHMNIVQSTYAMFIGAFIGLLRYKYGNIRICCLAHIVNNTIATFGAELLAKTGLSDTSYYILLAIFGLVSIAVIIKLIKTPARNIDPAPQAA